MHSFEDFLEKSLHEVERGFYSRYLKMYLKHFDRSHMLILFHERATGNVEHTVPRLADFLEVDASLFSEEAGNEVRNSSTAPRFRAAFSEAISRDAGCVAAISTESSLPPSKLGLKRLFGRRTEQRALMQPATRARLAQLYADDINELEALTGFSLDSWKEADHPKRRGR